MLDKVGDGSVQQMFTQQKEKAGSIQIKQNIDAKQLPQDQKEAPVQGVNGFANTHLKFEFHDELQEYYVAIVDDDTQEVVKEIPPKKLLDLYAAMAGTLGVAVDWKI
ncbi:MAG: flagellar protein FlaG [Bacillus sp. (in: firmicutes)]